MLQWSSVSLFLRSINLTMSQLTRRVKTASGISAMTDMPVAVSASQQISSDSGSEEESDLKSWTFQIVKNAVKLNILFKGTVLASCCR